MGGPSSVYLCCSLSSSFTPPHTHTRARAPQPQHLPHISWPLHSQHPLFSEQEAKHLPGTPYISFFWTLFPTGPEPWKGEGSLLWSCKAHGTVMNI